MVVENYSTTASCVVTVKAGVDYSEVGIGDAPSVTIASATTKVIGGKETSINLARFVLLIDVYKIPEITFGFPKHSVSVKHYVLNTVRAFC